MPKLIVSLLALAAAPTAAGNWTLFESDSAGDYFLDSAAPAVDGDKVRFRIRQRPPAERRALFDSAVAHLRIDCRAQTIAMESSATFDSSGSPLSTEHVPAVWEDSDPIYEGSVEEKLYLRLCPSPLRRALGTRPPPPPIMVMPPPIAMPLPVAPPAPPPPPPPPLPADYPVVRAQQRIQLGSLFTEKDYPAASLRAGEEGSVRYRLTVNRDGRVSECVITASSGSASLDSATCRILTQRARFVPARTAKGKRTVDRIAGSIRWRFPEEAAPAPLPQSESSQ